MRVDPIVLDDRQQARLAATRFSQVIQLGETPSTNLEAVRRARSGAGEGLVVVADYQTAGRGRFDRRWESPPGVSLLVSVLLRPSPADLPAERRHLAVAAVSVAVMEGAATVSGARLGLKWPNDIVAAGGEGTGGQGTGGQGTGGQGTGGQGTGGQYTGGDAGLKVAGALAEVVGPPSPGIVVGVGLNVGWAPTDVAATSLEALVGHPVPRGEVLVESLLALDRLYGSWDEVVGRYRRSCTTLGREVVVHLAAGPRPGGVAGAGAGAGGQGPAQVRGMAVDLDEEGRLIVRAPSGELVAVAAGDVFHARSAQPSNLSQQ